MAPSTCSPGILLAVVSGDGAQAARADGRRDGRHSSGRHPRPARQGLRAAHYELWRHQFRGLRPLTAPSACPMDGIFVAHARVRPRASSLCLLFNSGAPLHSAGQIHCDGAPLTAENFMTLAARGYYDGVSFHRLIPNFMVRSLFKRADLV
jgi:hypothetical protein